MLQRLLRNSTAKTAELFNFVISELASMKKSVITAEFILLALIEQKDSIVLKIIDELNLDTHDIRKKILDNILNELNKIPNFKEEKQVNIQISKEVNDIFIEADRIKNMLGDSYISTGAVFLACLNSDIKNVYKILIDIGLDYDKCYKALLNIRGSAKIVQKDSESRQSLLDQYTVDITSLARKGLLDPVIGRSAEINRVIEIISRRKKNNPILIGDPGVGKTVIVEGLAQQIVSADVPEYLLNKRILSLEMSSLIAGAKIQGEFEERLKTIQDEIIASSGDIILFIDEIHTVVGTGRNAGALDASNMLKPTLAKGLLKCIGATTYGEYKTYIESDKALARRFQKVQIEEPSVEDTIDIIEGLKLKYEQHHSTVYSKEAVESAVKMSSRYITDRYLPDKAIDLIDEAGAYKRLKVIYTPPEIRELETKKQNLNIKKLEAFNERNFEKMSKYHMKILDIESKLTKSRKKYNDKLDNKDFVVTESDIANIIHRMTKIPVDKITETENKRLIRLEKDLKNHIIGQDHVISSVSNAIRRNRLGLKQKNTPISSFLFLGPTGVGKTETTKRVADLLFNNKIIRIDMSEYMQKHEASKLIGSPPGYIGYGEGGQLTEMVKKNPYSIVLFDEFEKAHPDVYHILLQILDEGWLHDSQGNKISFSNTIVIGTSNIGSQSLSGVNRQVSLGKIKDDPGQDHQIIKSELKKHIKPELINRFDEIIVFNRLGDKQIAKILDLNIEDLKNRLNNIGISVDIDENIKNYILKNTDVYQYGARPIKRRVTDLIENKITNFIINKGNNKLNLKLKLENDEIFVE